jgi:hypothetical protein
MALPLPDHTRREEQGYFNIAQIFSCQISYNCELMTQYGQIIGLRSLLEQYLLLRFMANCFSSATTSPSVWLLKRLLLQDNMGSNPRISLFRLQLVPIYKNSKVYPRRG